MTSLAESTLVQRLTSDFNEQHQLLSKSFHQQLSELRHSVETLGTVQTNDSQLETLKQRLDAIAGDRASDVEQISHLLKKTAAGVKNELLQNLARQEQKWESKIEEKVRVDEVQGALRKLAEDFHKSL
jgi:hypothetical protein